MDQVDIRTVSVMIQDIEVQDYWGEESHGDRYSKRLWMELLSDLNDRLMQLEPES